MTRYVALLRGINVGGVTIRMADLRTVFTDLGFDDVTTVLASGNVLFSSDSTDVAGLKATIEAALRSVFGYEAWVFVLSTATLGRIVESYPFDAQREGWHPYVVFTAEPSVLDGLLAAAGAPDPAVERVAAGPGVVYWEVERGMTLKSSFGKNTGKAKLRAVTTTRNLRTLVKLLP